MLIKLLIKSYYIINIAMCLFFKRDTVSYPSYFKFYRGYSITLLSPVADNYKLIIIRNFNRLLIKKAYYINY